MLDSHPLQTRRTADSDKYDKESNDRLVQAAVAYCEAHAKKFAPPAAVPQVDGWQLVPGQAVNYTAKATGPAVDGQRPFSLQIGWLAGFEPGMTLRFPVCPGKVDGFLFRLPASVVGKTMAVSTTLDAAAVKTESVTLTSLQMQVAVGGEDGAAGNDGGAAGNDGGDCGGGNGDGGDGDGDGGGGAAGSEAGAAGSEAGAAGGEAGAAGGDGGDGGLI